MVQMDTNFVCQNSFLLGEGLIKQKIYRNINYCSYVKKDKFPQNFLGFHYWVRHAKKCTWSSCSVISFGGFLPECLPCCWLEFPTRKKGV